MVDVAIVTIVTFVTRPIEQLIAGVTIVAICHSCDTAFRSARALRLLGSDTDRADGGEGARDVLLRREIRIRIDDATVTADDVGSAR